MLVQFGLKKLADLKDAAHIYDYAKSSEDREIFDVAFGPHVLGRPVIAPPGVPADRASALRAAFMRTMHDAELLAETSKLGLEIAAVVRRRGRGAGGALRIVSEERDRACDRGDAREAVTTSRGVDGSARRRAYTDRGQQGQDRVELVSLDSAP